MLGLVLNIKEYIKSSITTEYVSSIQTTNMARSTLAAGNFASSEFGLNSVNSNWLFNTNSNSYWIEGCRDRHCS